MSSVSSVASAPTIAARRLLAKALRDKVAGEDAPAKAAEIWHAPGDRWFTRADPIWVVHMDAAMFVGGIRALLLQSLHPLAMAGVAGHSGYKSDPWGRLQRTSHFLAVTTFGPVPSAEAAIARVRSIHDRVRGRAPDGRGYAASDQRLLAWVHAAEADSFLTSHQAFGNRRLDPDQADAYVEQSGRIARLLGADPVPSTVDELKALLGDFRAELAATDAAREAARFLLLDPPLTWSARPGYGLLAASAVSLLAPWSREMLDLPRLPVVERAVVRPLGILATSTIRWAMNDPGDVRNPRSDAHRETYAPDH